MSEIEEVVGRVVLMTESADKVIEDWGECKVSVTWNSESMKCEVAVSNERGVAQSGELRRLPVLMKMRDSFGFCLLWMNVDVCVRISFSSWRSFSRLRDYFSCIGLAFSSRHYLSGALRVFSESLVREATSLGMRLEHVRYIPLSFSVLSKCYLNEKLIYEMHEIWISELQTPLWLMQRKAALTEMLDRIASRRMLPPLCRESGRLISGMIADGGAKRMRAERRRVSEKAAAMRLRNDERLPLALRCLETLRVVGSMAMGLDSRRSDVDCTIDLSARCDSRESEISELRQLAQLIASAHLLKPIHLLQQWHGHAEAAPSRHSHDDYLKRGDFGLHFGYTAMAQRSDNTYSLRIEFITSSKVPLIKVHDDLLDLHVDISATIANIASVEYIGRLVQSALPMGWRHYENRLIPLIATVKYWSHCRKVNGAFKRFINSYGFVLICIKYAQMLAPRLVEIAADASSPPIAPSECVSNTMRLCDLVFGFFEFLLNYNSRLFMIDIAAIGLRPKPHDVDSALIIIDPVKRNSNVANNMNQRTANIMWHEFGRAFALMRAGCSWRQVCQVKDSYYS